MGATDTEPTRALSDALRALEVRSATRDFASGIIDPEAPDFGALARQAEALEAALYHLRVAAQWAAVTHRNRPGSTEADAAMARLAALTTNPTAPQGG